MIEVKMTDDIRKKETKAAGPFTIRQLICIAIGAAYAVPIAFSIPADISIKIIVGMLLAMPTALCGFIKLNKEPFEIVLIRWVYKHFLTPCRRKVKARNSYYQELKHIRTKKNKNGKSKNEITYSKKNSLMIYR